VIGQENNHLKESRRSCVISIVSPPFQMKCNNMFNRTFLSKSNLVVEFRKSHSYDLLLEVRPLFLDTLLELKSS